MTTLPIKKIYIDTKYKSEASVSNSDFKIDLPQSLTFPENSVFYIDDVSIPHSWYVVETGINDKLYLHTLETNFGTVTYDIIRINEGNYNGVDLALELSNRINTAVDPSRELDIYSVTYSIKTNTITMHSIFEHYRFKLLTADDLKSKLNNTWDGDSYDVDNPQDINEVIGNVEGNSIYYEYPFGYISKTLNLQTIRNIYIHSSLGNYNTIGPRGESSIIKKVPVNANKGEYIFDQVLTSNDFGDCSRQTLRTIKFDLKDSKGNHIPFHGSNLSFSIIFSRMNSDI